jgi:hypothetical protein
MMGVRMELEEVEAKLLADTHAAYERLSDSAKREFMMARSWAESHLGGVVAGGVLLGILAGLALAHMGWL